MASALCGFIIFYKKYNTLRREMKQLHRKNPLVTVATATYKKYDQLYQCIDSVLMQDYEPIEYIISDDGCSAFPKEEIEQYILKKKEITLFRFLLFAMR